MVPRGGRQADSADSPVWRRMNRGKVACSREVCWPPLRLHWERHGSTCRGAAWRGRRKGAALTTRSPEASGCAPRRRCRRRRHGWGKARHTPDLPQHCIEPRRMFRGRRGLRRGCSLQVAVRETARHAARCPFLPLVPTSEVPRGWRSLRRLARTCRLRSARRSARACSCVCVWGAQS